MSCFSVSCPGTRRGSCCSSYYALRSLTSSSLSTLVQVQPRASALNSEFRTRHVSVVYDTAMVRSQAFVYPMHSVRTICAMLQCQSELLGTAPMTLPIFATWGHHPLLLIWAFISTFLSGVRRLWTHFGSSELGCYPTQMRNAAHCCMRCAKSCGNFRKALRTSVFRACVMGRRASTLGVVLRATERSNMSLVYQAGSHQTRPMSDQGKSIMRSIIPEKKTRHALPSRQLSTAFPNDRQKLMVGKCHGSFLVDEKTAKRKSVKAVIQLPTYL